MESFNKINPLPPVVIYENHMDLSSKSTLMVLLPVLKKLGYDALCLEASSDLSEREIVSAAQYRVKEDEELYCTAVNLLQKNSVTQAPEKISFKELQRLIHLFVSSKHPTLVAQKVKTYPASQLTLNLIDVAKREKIEIVGIDTTLEKLQPIYSDQNSALSNISHETLITERDRVLADNLAKLHSSGRGVIFLCGLAHATGVTEHLKKNGIQEEGVVSQLIMSNLIHSDLTEINPELLPSTPFSREQIDFADTQNEINQLAERITQKTISIHNLFTKELLYKITHKINLESAFGVNVSCFMRPGKYLEGRILITPDLSLELIKSQLDNHSIEFTFCEMNGFNYLSIPNINTLNVARNIERLANTLQST